MRGIFLSVALLWATVGASYSSQKNTLQQKDSLLTTAATAASTNIPTREPDILSSSIETSSMATNADSTTSSIMQSEIPTIILSENDSELPASQASMAQQPPRRRTITYDQRQEGQYNIRADLENFMIIMVPQTPSLFSELFLTKALRHRSSSSKEKAKGKHPSNVVEFLKFHENSKKIPNLNFNVRPPVPIDNASLRGKQSPVAIVEGDLGHTRRLPEFIEGRTPYHVDISASENEHSRLHPDSQVDVLPPPYPLAYQHLKPYHLEAEPTVIQALPPSELHAAHVSDKFLETYNQLLTSGLKNAAAAAAAESGSRARYNNDGPELGYYRISRSIRGGNSALDSDSPNSLNSLRLSSSSRSTELPVYRREHSLGATSLYPPIDVPRTFEYLTLSGDDARRIAEYQETTDIRDQVLDEDFNVGKVILPSLDITVPQDDIELELHGVSLLDRAAKTLLSDGMERCAPGHRRDSYGLCREIEGY